ncbi:MAG: hypothetical protein ACI837_002825 [Crocinitomicaceae bacterium]|jgi:hypothetical protein
MNLARKLIFITFLCPFVLTAQFDQMKLLGITQVNQSHRFSDCVPNVEDKVTIWDFNSSRKDSSLHQEPMICKYNSLGAPTLISFNNGKPRYEFNYENDRLAKITEHGSPRNPFLQVFKISYDEQNRFSAYERISIEDNGDEEVTARSKYSYIELTDSTDSVLLESKYGTSYMTRKFNANDQLTGYASYNSRGSLLDEGKLIYVNDVLKEQTIIHHYGSSSEIELYTYTNGVLDLVTTSENGVIIEVQTFTYSKDGRLLLYEKDKTSKAFSREYHAYK